MFCVIVLQCLTFSFVQGYVTQGKQMTRVADWALGTTMWTNYNSNSIVEAPAGFMAQFPVYLKGQLQGGPCSRIASHYRGGANVKVEGVASMGLMCPAVGTRDKRVAPVMYAAGSTARLDMDYTVFNLDINQIGQSFSTGTSQRYRYFVATVPAGDWTICCNNGYYGDAGGAFVQSAPLLTSAPTPAPLANGNT